MDFIKLVSNVFYRDIKDALKPFADCLEFEIEHVEIKSENPFCVVAKNGLRQNDFSK